MRRQRLKWLLYIFLVVYNDYMAPLLTLMNPPSGFALRKAGCGFILGSISCTVTSFLNLGIGPRPAARCCG